MMYYSPSNYFQFEFPNIKDLPGYVLNGELFEQEIESFISDCSDPYISFDKNSKRRLSEYWLPYKYESNECYVGRPEDIADWIRDIGDINDDKREHKHILSEMTELDVSIAFIRRALEYHNLDLDNDSHPNFFNFLNFHYRNYNSAPHQWLDYVSTIFDDKTSDDTFIQKIGDQAVPIAIMRIRGIAKGWINKKREELEILEGIESPEEVILGRPNKEMIILLEKLGILELPIISKLTIEQKGVLFGHLLGFDAKNTENYIRYKGSKRQRYDPYVAYKGVYKENVKAFLKSLNIDIQ